MKKIINFVITIFISILICLLCVSFSLREIVINTLSKEIVKKEVSSKVTDLLKDTYSDIDYETLNEIETSIGNNENINRVTEKYFDDIINSVINDESVSIPNTKEEMLNIINDNEYILKENDVEITEEQKNELVNKLTSNNTIDKVYQNVANSIKDNMSSEAIMIISTYDKLTSSTFRWIVVSIIIILILLLAIIKKTYYRWTYNLGVSFALSGIVLSLLSSFVLDTISVEITEKLIGKAADININSLINLGYICFALCAVLIIIYIVGNKITNYSKRKNNY